MQKLGCQIDYLHGLLRIDNDTIHLHFNEPIYTIPPRSETVIECTVSNPNVKEGAILDQHISESLLIANCIVKVKENKRVNITVVNTAETPTVINPNLNLTIEPLDNDHCMTQYETLPIQSATSRTQKVLKQLRISHLIHEEKEALHSVCSNYSDIFHLSDEPLSHTTACEHTKSYRFPECHKKEVETQMNKMLEQNIITPSNSPWSSPIWVVPKKLDASGQRKWRIVIDVLGDYRNLNDITIGETYPIPQITEILDQLGKSQYITTLDLASGFHQIIVSPEDSSKTGFSVQQGQFQFTRMPLWLKNAPSTFQKLMNTCLSGLQGSRCFVYLDDIVVYSPDLPSHIQNLKAVFERLRNYFETST